LKKETNKSLKIRENHAEGTAMDDNQTETVLKPKCYHGGKSGQMQD
jgi:hypothetical protein